MSFKGLVHCTLATYSSSPACIEKSLEFTFTTILLIAIIINLAIRVNYQRQFNLYVVINLLMIATLTFNDFYTLFRVTELYRLESLWFDSYFPTLVYKFGMKLLEKNKTVVGKYNKIIVSFYVGYLLLVFADFMFVNITDASYCQQIPYLVLNLSGVTLSIWLIIFGYQHSKVEVEKNEIINQVVVADSEKYSNPLPTMWKCIAINILSQVVGLGRTVYFVIDRQTQCRFTDNEKGEAAIQFFFLVATYYVGMVATLLFFNEKRRSYLHWNKTNLRKSSGDEHKVELINVSNFEAKDRGLIF